MPTYPPAHVRFSVLAASLQADGAQEDIIEFGWCDDSGLTPEALCNAVAGNMDAAWTFPGAVISKYAVLKGFRAENVGADGKVSGSFFYSVPDKIGSSNGASCTVLSQALTLETGAVDAHGRKVRGRFYPPAYESLAGATASTSDTDGYATEWAAILSQYNQDGGKIAVASVTLGGRIVPVTGVSADNIIDTQRRRKNKVKSLRSATKALTS